MPLRTPEQYFSSLRDKRRVYYAAQPVPTLPAPVIWLAPRHAAVDYEWRKTREHRDLAVVDGVSRYFVFPPRSSEDLLARSG